MNDKHMKEALTAIADRGVPENTDLWPGLSVKLERHSSISALRTRPAATLVIILLILLAMSGAAFALGQILGYVPGVGIVERNSPLRILADPVSIKQDGITITVTRLVADSRRTFVAYKVEGIPFVENAKPSCFITPEIHLPDGGKLEMISGSGGAPLIGNGDFLSYEDEFTFSPIPNAGDTVSFVLPCSLPDGAVSENAVLLLHLVPAPEGYATPAVERVVPTDGIDNHTGLHLDEVLELADSYILAGRFTDGGDLSGPLVMSTSSDSDYRPRIEDAEGEPVPFIVREDSRPDPDWDVAYYWAYEIPKPVSTPLTITIDSVTIRKDYSAQTPFDAGEPHGNREWKPDRPVRLGSYTFRLDAITFIGDGYKLDLSYKSLPENVSFFINIIDASSEPFQFDHIDGTHIDDGNTAQDTITLTTQNPPPTGNMIIQWQLSETIPEPGPWTLIWTPPANKP